MMCTDLDSSRSFKVIKLVRIRPEAMKGAPFPRLTGTVTTATSKWSSNQKQRPDHSEETIVRKEHHQLQLPFCVNLKIVQSRPLL
jgi:hypothetical protein